MSSIQPVYIETADRGELAEKVKTAYRRMKSCTLCPRECSVDRISGETGICNTADKAYVSSYAPHFGEEAPLVGRKGSGTIFFTHCNLMCNFCQNYDISHQGQGREVSNDMLAQMMIDLQKAGCHNINFVTPSHVVPQILGALKIAIAEGLSVPLVYNSSAYDSVRTLQLLEGVFDIYMPDFKFWDPAVSDRTCGADDYPEVARNALIEMHRQVDDLTMDSLDIAQRGLLIRHLVLPEGLAGTREVMRFIARKLSADSYVNIMSQYRPCGHAAEVSQLAAPLSSDDYETAVLEAKKEGINRLDGPRRTFVLR